MNLGDVFISKERQEKEKKTMIIQTTTVSITMPEVCEECEGCRYYKETDNSFDHEFGTEEVIGMECNATKKDIEELGYDGCELIMKFIDDNYSSDVITDMEIEVSQ